MAAAIQKLDDNLGLGERVLIAITFAGLVAIGFYRTIIDLASNERPLWAIELIKVAVFAIAMLGAAYATHLKRNFSLDFISRYLPPRGRAGLRLLINALTAGAAVLLFYGGRLVQDKLGTEPAQHEVVPVTMLAWFIPVSAVLIMLHVLAHAAIEVVYLSNGRVAPDPDQGVG